MHTKFLALNVDFDGLSFHYLDLRKPAHESIKERYPRKSRYFSAVGQSFVKTVADRHGHAACYNLQQTLVTSFLVVSASMTLKDAELPKRGFIDFCNFRLGRTFQ